MSEHSNFVEWLADPAKVLRFVNFILALTLLALGYTLADIAGLAFAVIGTVVIIELRRMRQ